MRRFSIILTIVMAGWIPPAAAQDASLAAQPLTLSEVLDLVRLGNHASEAASLRAEAERTRSAQVTSLPDPMVGFVVSSADPERRSMVEASQRFPFPGKLKLLGEAADAGARAAGLEVDIVDAENRLKASHAFFEIGAVDAQLELIDAYRADLLGFERSAVVQYEQGAGPQQAILKAQLEKNMLTERIAMLHAMRNEQRATLAALTGDPTIRQSLDRPFLLPAPPDSVIPGLAEGSADRRPEMHQLIALRDRTDHELAYAHRSFLPDFMAIASFSRMNGIGIGGGVTIPLWRNPRRAAVEEARVRGQALDASMTDLDMQIRASIEGVTARLNAGIETIVLLRKTLLPQAKAALDATTSAYVNGRTDFLDLLDSQRMLFTLRMNLIDVTTRALRDTASLEFAARTPILPAFDAN